MEKILNEFFKNEEGQDLIEYTLLISFMMMVIVALVVSNGRSIAGILFVTTNNLNAANHMAS